MVYSEAKLAGSQGNEARQREHILQWCVEMGGGQKKAVQHLVVSCPQGSSPPLPVIGQGLILCLLCFTMSFTHQKKMSANHAFAQNHLCHCDWRWGLLTLVHPVLDPVGDGAGQGYTQDPGTLKRAVSCCSLCITSRPWTRP